AVLYLARHTPDDLLVLGQQIVAAHPRLTGKSGGDDDDVGSRRVLVAICPDDVRLVADDRSRLVQVECLALRHSLHDVHKDHVGIVTFRNPLCSRRTDIARTDYCYLSPHHQPFRSNGGRVWLISLATNWVRSRND